MSEGDPPVDPLTPTHSVETFSTLPAERITHRARARPRDAQRRTFLQAWHLRHLLPKTTRAQVS
jgi:hypothetical protein